MQTARPDISDFVKAAPPDFKNPESCPALVLNADFRPLSYYPLSLWAWQDTLKAVFLDRVNIVSEYDTIVRSPSTDFVLPSVVSLKTYVKPPRYPAFTRFNVFLRDGFSCQYCGSPQDLTFDHVTPRRAGGRTTWENVVAACSPCNLRKGGRLPKQAWCRAISRVSRQCLSCTKPDDGFRQITAMKAGRIICIGIPSLSRKRG